MWRDPNQKAPSSVLIISKKITQSFWLTRLTRLTGFWEEKMLKVLTSEHYLQNSQHHPLNWGNAWKHSTFRKANGIHTYLFSIN